MADYRANTDIAGLRPRFFNPSGTTEPDLGPDKTGRTGDNARFGRTSPALCQDSEHRNHGGGSDPRISNLAIIGLADISLQKTAKTARSGRGRPVCEGAVRQCYRPHPAVPRTGPHGLPSRCSAKFGETDGTRSAGENLDRKATGEGFCEI